MSVSPRKLKQYFEERKTGTAVNHLIPHKRSWIFNQILDYTERIVREDMRHFETGFFTDKTDMPEGYDMPADLYLAIESNLKWKISEHE